MCRPWGEAQTHGRHGKERIATDVDARAAAVDWARLATLGVTFAGGDLDNRPTMSRRTHPFSFPPSRPPPSGPPRPKIPKIKGELQGENPRVTEGQAPEA